METSLISAIAAIIWKPLSSDRSDSNNTRMHWHPLLEDLSNPKFISSLSFPSSFKLKSTHEYKKTTFKQESTIHSRHVEFDEWREQCVRRRSPRPSFTFSAIVAIAAIIWKTQIATITELFFSASSDRSDHMETSLQLDTSS